VAEGKDVIAFTQARATTGGTGALLVLLAPVPASSRTLACPGLAS